MIEIVTILISKEKLQSLIDSGALFSSEFKPKVVEIHDDLFVNDDDWKELKKHSDKAFKKLKEYEFKTRYK